MKPHTTLNYTEAYTSKNGYNHATTTDGRGACGLSGKLIINTTYKHAGPWNNNTPNKCGLCQKHLTKTKDRQ